MTTKNLISFVFISVILLVMTLIIALIEWIIIRIRKEKRKRCIQTFVILAEAIWLFGLIQWHIAIFLWIGSFLATNGIILKKIFFESKEATQKKEDCFFVIVVFLSSLVFIFLPHFFSLIKFLEILPGPEDLFLHYLNNALCLSGILFVFYAIGFRPWEWQHGLVSPLRRIEDNVDVISRKVDAIICIILFIAIQTIYALIYFNFL